MRHHVACQHRRQDGRRGAAGEVDHPGESRPEAPPLTARPFPASAGEGGPERSEGPSEGLVSAAYTSVILQTGPKGDSMRKLALLFLLLSSPLFAQNASVHGRVTMSDGSALPGVTISVEGTSTTAVTDGEGRYTIAVP